MTSKRFALLAVSLGLAGLLAGCSGSSGPGSPGPGSPGPGGTDPSGFGSLGSGPSTSSAGCVKKTKHTDDDQPEGEDDEGRSSAQCPPPSGPSGADSGILSPSSSSGVATPR